MTKTKDGFYKLVDSTIGSDDYILLAKGGLAPIQYITGPYGYILKKYTVNAYDYKDGNDTKLLDENTYYPVTFTIPTNHNVRIECIVALDSNTKPSWSTHSGGFSTKKIWEVVGSGWGRSNIARRILVSDCSWCDVDPVRNIGLIIQNSTEYVYVRGGGKYHFYISDNISPEIHPKGKSWVLSGSTYSIPTISNIDSLPIISASQYWANVPISTTPSTETNPTFKNVTVNTLTISNTSVTNHIKFSRESFNYITAPSNGLIAFVVNGLTVTDTTSDLIIKDGFVYPGSNNVTSLGDSSHRWLNVYSTHGNFSNTVYTPTVYSDGSILTLCGSNIYIKPNGSSTSDSESIYINKEVFRPFTSANLKIDLGSSTARWKGLYAGTGNFSDKVTITSGGMSVTGTAYFGGGTTYYFGSTGNINCNSLTVNNTSTFKGKVDIKNALNSYINFYNINDTASSNPVTAQIHSVCGYDSTKSSYIQGGNFYFRLFSNNGTTINTNGYEDYILGLCDQSLTSRVVYKIYTEKFKQPYLPVHDVRDVNRSTSYFTNKTLSAWFNQTGMPSSTWYSGITVKGWENSYLTWLLASGSTTSINNNLYFRVGLSDSWLGWNKIWHNNNDGSGSGLDADLLDGKHASGFGIWCGSANTDPTEQRTLSTTTTELIERIHAVTNLFDYNFSAMRGGWYFNGNTDYATPWGTFSMAGTAVLNISVRKDVTDTGKSLLFIDSLGDMYSYISNGSKSPPDRALWSRYFKQGNSSITIGTKKIERNGTDGPTTLLLPSYQAGGNSEAVFVTIPKNQWITKVMAGCVISGTAITNRIGNIFSNATVTVSNGSKETQYMYVYTVKFYHSIRPSSDNYHIIGNVRSAAPTTNDAVSLCIFNKSRDGFKYACVTAKIYDSSGDDYMVALSSPTVEFTILEDVEIY